MDFQSILRRRTHSYHVLAVIWISLILAILSFYLLQTWQFTFDNVAASSANEAEVLSRTLQAALRRVDATLEWTGDRMLRGSAVDDPAILQEDLVAVTRHFPEIRGLVLRDIEGSPVATIGDAALVCEAILDVRLTGGRERFSETWDCGHTGNRVMQVTESIHRSDHTIHGTVHAVIDLTHFEELFSQMDVGPGGMVSIRRSDSSALVVRWPLELERLNNLAPDIPPHRRIEEGSPRGVVRYVGATDGVDRVFAYNAVSGYPFYVLVGRATREQFALWRLISGIAVCAALMMITVTVILVRRLNRETSGLLDANDEVVRIMGKQEVLIRELLHRTNNSLQVVRSLVQLELMDAPSSWEAPALQRLDRRIHTLSLVQTQLKRENDFSRVDLQRYLTVLGRDAFPEIAPDIACPGVVIVLDVAAPMGLVVGELLRLSRQVAGGVADGDGSSVSISVIVESGGEVHLSYTDTRGLELDHGTREFLAALVEHQLRGSLTLLMERPFGCILKCMDSTSTPRFNP